MRLFLLFDPDGDSRAILATYLRHLGHQVLDTDIPGDALALARQHRPDLVVAEFLHPFSPAASLLEALRLDPTTTDIPVVVWTSRVESHTVTRIRELGAVFVAKPTPPSTVYRAAQSALEHRGFGPSPPLDGPTSSAAPEA